MSPSSWPWTPLGQLLENLEAKVEEDNKSLEQLKAKAEEDNKSQEELKAKVEEHNKSLEEIKQLLKAKVEAETKYTMADCLEIVERLEVNWYHGDSFFHVSKMFADEGNREIFMNMSDRLRVEWINGAMIYASKTEMTLK